MLLDKIISDVKAYRIVKKQLIKQYDENPTEENRIKISGVALVIFNLKNLAHFVRSKKNDSDD